MAKTTAERQRALRERNRSIRKMTLKQIWVKPEKWADIQKAIARIQGAPR